MATFTLERSNGRNPNPNPNPNRRFWFEDASNFADEEEEDEGEQYISSDDDYDDDDDADDVLISEGISRTKVDDVAEVVGDVDGHCIITMTDQDVLDCPICIEPLTIPVFQCENGHIACSLCSPRVRNKCPSCAKSIGYIRCRAMEQVVESVKISCRNSKFGCTEKTKYSIKHEHENTCIYTPCSCPQKDCPFLGSSSQLSAHFTSKHPNMAKSFHFDENFQIHLDLNQKYIILQENGGQLFILYNTEHQSLGNIIFVTCIEPDNSKEEFSYYLVVKKDGYVLKLECVADNVAKRVENPNCKRFLMVPYDFVDSCNIIKVDLEISYRFPKTWVRGVSK